MKRVVCEVCGKPLLAFAGRYLHPNEPCSGLDDGLKVTIEVEDDFIAKEFLKKYGKPEADDYAVLNKLQSAKLFKLVSRLLGW